MTGATAAIDPEGEAPGASRPRVGIGFVLVTAIATIAGAWLRTGLASSSGLWRDEAQSLAISQLPTLRDMFLFLAREDSHPPLFYVTERLWVAVFGSSDAAVVALGLIPGILVIPTAAWVAWRFAGRHAGVLAAWFTALAWPSVWQSGDARPYAFLSLVTLLTAAAALSAARGRSIGPWRAYAVGCLTLLYTHNWWLLVVAVLAALTFWRAWVSNPGSRAWLRPWLVSHAIIACVYLPWMPVLLGQGRSAGYAAPAHFPLEWPVVAAVIALGVTLPLLLPGLALILLGRFRTGEAPAGPGPGWFLGLAAALPCGLALAGWRFTDLTVTYCAAAVSPLTLVAVACGLGRNARPATRPRQLLSGVLLLTTLGLATASRWYRKSSAREAAGVVARLAGPDDLVIVYPSSIGPVFLRYLTPGARVVVFPPQNPIAPTRFGGWWGRFDDPNALSRAFQHIDAARRSGEVVWFVSQLRVDHSPDSTAPVGTRDRFRHSVGARRVDLRARLQAAYGPPTHVASPPAGSWMREMVEVERYGP